MGNPTDSDPRHRFLAQFAAAADDGTLEKLTLGKYRGPEPGLQNLFVRPVELKAGRRLSFVWRYATRDVTKNYETGEAVRKIDDELGSRFLDAHLFSPDAVIQFATDDSGKGRIRSSANPTASEKPAAHDREKTRLIPATTPWLADLGVTNEQGRVREAQADKFRQINKFAEVIVGLIDEGFGTADASSRDKAKALQIVDMGSGKGYLTFAIAGILGERAAVRGIEARAELVELTNRAARRHGLDSRLKFERGTIGETELGAVDVLVALHACDTATDDALAKGIAAGARLLVVSPCCQKELRPNLQAPPVLAGALRHGIFAERQAEFVTDALRAELLEWCGYRTKVFEFISTEHTAKNLMIAAVKVREARDEAAAIRIRALAAFYGITQQSLASAVHFDLKRAAEDQER